MTRLVDGSVSIWEESQEAERLYFSLKLCLSERLTVVCWLPSPSQYLLDVLEEDSHRKLLDSGHPSHLMASSLSRHYVTPVNASVWDGQDWIIGATNDGSVTIWILKGLGLPRSSPTATISSNLVCLTILS